MNKMTLFKKTIWVTLILLLALTSCSMLGTNSEPTAIVYPTAAIITTSEPPTVVPTSEPLQPTQVPQPPSVKILLDLTDTEVVLGNQINVEFEAQDDAGLSHVELALGDGEVLGSEGSPVEPIGETWIQYGFIWEPDTVGEHILHLTAYDEEKNNIAQDIVRITVFPAPEIIKYGEVFLKTEESFDFVTEKTGHFDGGDLYVYSAGLSLFDTGANNYPQIGGQVLFAAGELDFVTPYTAESIISEPSVIKKILSADTQTNFSDGSVLELSGVYLFRRNQAPGEYILFQVSKITPDGVMLDYVVFNMPK